jgi:hypothetical protein
MTNKGSQPGSHFAGLLDLHSRNLRLDLLQLQQMGLYGLIRDIRVNN